MLRTSRFVAVLVAFLVAGVPLVNAQVNECINAPDDLVAWWPGDGNAKDIQGANEGTLINGATADGVGLVGSSFSFDGVNTDFVEIANKSSMDFGTGDFTIDLWINFNSLATVQTMFHKSIGNVFLDTNKTYFLEFNPIGVRPADSLRFRVSDIFTNVNDLIVPAPLVVGTWHHIAGVRKGNLSSLYLDGDLIGEQRSGDNIDTGTGGGARIGRTVFNGVPNINRPVNGRVDEVELFARALNARQIQTIFEAGAAGKCKADRFWIEAHLSLEQVGLDVLLDVDAEGLVPDQDFTVRAYVPTVRNCMRGVGHALDAFSGMSDKDGVLEISGTIEDVDDVGSVSIRRSGLPPANPPVVCFQDTTP